jgi:FlgD Ig-like domain
MNRHVALSFAIASVIGFHVATASQPCRATSPATIHVPGDYPTIQAGIAAAIYGDTVEITCGTYSENDVQLKNGVIVQSENGDPDCVIIDGQYGNLFSFGAGDTVTMIGLTITHAYHGLDGPMYGGTGAANLYKCRFVQAGYMWVNVPGSFVDVDFINNGGETTPITVGGSSTFIRCHFVGNGSPSGGALSASGTFVDCLFESNYTTLGSGAIEGDVLVLLRCLFIGNTTAGLPGLPLAAGAITAQKITATECVFYDNSVDLGGENACGSQITLTGGASTLTRCIIAGISGVDAVCCTNGATVSATCTDIYGPPEFSWVGCLAGQLGLNGNISSNPVFCDAANGDFRLSSISPCLDTPCGTMGAFGLGCYDAKPGIISINDVGNDQGRQVRITWYRAQDDFSGSPFDGYAIYRRQDLYAAGPPASQTSGRGPFAIPGWDYITTIPDRGDDLYQAIVPTLCDSTITAGQCWSAFFVSALTPTAFYDSPIDSGYSKDNLAPPTPTSFAVSYNTGSGNHLGWDAVAANDFAGFRIYRGTTPSFVPSPATLVYSTSQTAWIDPTFAGWDVSYKVTSFDLAGNESAPTSTGTVTGADDRPRALVLELGPNIPNPFNPSTRIPFTIPSAGRVRITVYDVSGALVRVVADRELPAGSHEAVWDGKDDSGRTLSSGVYLCRLEHPAGIKARKLLALK